jgi:hypothetical protein
MNCSKEKILEFATNFLTQNAKELALYYDTAMMGVGVSRAYRSPSRIIYDVFVLLGLPTKNEAQMENFILACEEYSLISVNQMNPDVDGDTYDSCEDLVYKLVELKEMMEV